MISRRRRYNFTEPIDDDAAADNHLSCAIKSLPGRSHQFPLATAVPSVQDRDCLAKPATLRYPPTPLGVAARIEMKRKEDGRASPQSPRCQSLRRKKEEEVLSPASVAHQRNALYYSSCRDSSSLFPVLGNQRFSPWLPPPDQSPVTEWRKALPTCVALIESDSQRLVS